MTHRGKPFFVAVAEAAGAARPLRGKRDRTDKSSRLGENIIPRRRHLALSGACAGLLLAFGTPSVAATYDPFGQFSVSGNVPNTGNFAYGTYNVSTGVLSPFPIYEEACRGDARFSCGVADPFDFRLPAVFKNVTGSYFDAGTGNFPTDRLIIHPDIGEYAGLVFLAPSPGTYSFVGEFSLQDDFATGVDTGSRSLTQTYLPSSVLSGPVVNNAGPIRAFSFNATLAAGEGLAFYAGPGPSGDRNNDSTGIRLLVSDVVAPVASVPEPTTWAMMIMGFGMVGGAMRAGNRRNKARRLTV